MGAGNRGLAQVVTNGHAGSTTRSGSGRPKLARRTRVLTGTERVSVSFIRAKGLVRRPIRKDHGSGKTLDERVERQGSKSTGMIERGKLHPINRLRHSS